MFSQDGNIPLNTFFALICYILNFFSVYVAENTPANRHPLAMILTPVDQRLQSHIHTLPHVGHKNSEKFEVFEL